MIFSKLIKPIGIGASVIALCAFGLTNVSADEMALKKMGETIKQQQQQLEELQRQFEMLKEMATSNEMAVTKAAAKEDKDYGLTVYGSIRPALTHSDFGDSTSTDVTDFLSRMGIKGEVGINDRLTAFYRGEWDVDIEDDADFGDARLAYVGIKGRAGQIAIGKQWNPHFNIVAEVVDIYNHRSSPFAYDEASPFRTNQMLTYSYSQGGFKLDSGVQFNGDPENGAGGSNASASEPNNVDSASLGVGYSTGPFYAGVSYLEQQGESDYERSFMGVAASWNMTDNFYLAATYQDIDVDNVVDDMGNEADYDQSSFDLAASVSLGGGYKIKTSYFDWDGDDLGRSFDGYNLTLENQISDSVRLFAEWLQRDIEGGEEEDYLSLGIRYDFEAHL